MPPGPAQVRHVGAAFGEFSAPGDELRRHPVESNLVVVAVELVARILGEVRRSRGCRCAVDGRQQHEVAARVVYKSAAERDAELVMVEPEALIEHPGEEVLRRDAAVVLLKHCTLGAGALMLLT